jgi:signal transduction histidine kinase
VAREEPAARAAREAALEADGPQLFRLERRGSERRRPGGFCVALRVRSRVLGLLEVHGPRSLVEKETSEILYSLTNAAASALENARLYGEVAERERRLKDLVGKLIMTQEEERRRIAYEVHDGLTQMAVAAFHHMQAFAGTSPPSSEESKELLDRSLELVRSTVGEARRVIADLRPTALDDFGLAIAIRLQIEALNEEGWQVSYKNGLGEERLPVAVETALYRVAQEALTNVRKHAGTKRTLVELGREGENVRLHVRDWGKGFDPTAALDRIEGPGERVGLSSMRERVELVGGTFELRSEAGSSVTAVVPVAEEEVGPHGAWGGPGGG